MFVAFLPGRREDKPADPVSRDGLAALLRACGQQAASRCQLRVCLWCRSCLTKEYAFLRGSHIWWLSEAGTERAGISAPRGTMQMGSTHSRALWACTAAQLPLCPGMPPPLATHRGRSLERSCTPNSISAPASEKPSLQWPRFHNTLPLFICTIMSWI